MGPVVWRWWGKAGKAETADPGSFSVSHIFLREDTGGLLPCSVWIPRTSETPIIKDKHKHAFESSI